MLSILSLDLIFHHSGLEYLLPIGDTMHLPIVCGEQYHLMGDYTYTESMVLREKKSRSGVL